MRPFAAAGNTFAPFAFRDVDASLLEVAAAGFGFPIFKDRKASLGYQSGAAEFCEPVRYQHQINSVTRSINAVQRTQLPWLFFPTLPISLPRSSDHTLEPLR